LIAISRDYFPQDAYLSQGFVPIGKLRRIVKNWGRESEPLTSTALPEFLSLTSTGATGAGTAGSDGGDELFQVLEDAALELASRQVTEAALDRC
jgi:hypothetical protein